MVGQSPLAQARDGPRPNAVTDLFHKVRQMGELQARLFVADWNDFARSAVKPCFAIVVTIAVCLAALPVGLIGLA